MVESLTDQNYVLSLIKQRLEESDAGGIQAGFDLVVKVLLAQQVQTILAYAAEQRMKNSGGEHAVGCVQERTKES
jgi:hypothetical protein